MNRNAITGRYGHKAAYRERIRVVRRRKLSELAPRLETYLNRWWWRNR